MQVFGHMRAHKTSNTPQKMKEQHGVHQPKVSPVGMALRWEAIIAGCAAIYVPQLS